MLYKFSVSALLAREWASRILSLSGTPSISMGVYRADKHY